MTSSSDSSSSGSTAAPLPAGVAAGACSRFRLALEATPCMLRAVEHLLGVG